MKYICKVYKIFINSNINIYIININVYKIMMKGNINIIIKYKYTK